MESGAFIAIVWTAAATQSTMTAPGNGQQRTGGDAILPLPYKSHSSVPSFVLAFIVWDRTTSAETRLRPLYVGT